MLRSVCVNGCRGEHCSPGGRVFRVRRWFGKFESQYRADGQWPPLQPIGKDVTDSSKRVGNSQAGIAWADDIRPYADFGHVPVER